MSNSSGQQEHVTVLDTSNINFKRGSSATSKNQTDDTDSLEETYDTFETLIVQQITPLQQDDTTPTPTSIKNNESTEFLSKSSFNDFEYWNTRSISNIDSLLMVDPLNNADELGACNYHDEDDEENIYANDDTQILEYVYEAGSTCKSASGKKVETMSGDDLVNAYYARKMGTNAPLCDIKACTQDTQSISSSTGNNNNNDNNNNNTEAKPGEAITYLQWDYENNTFVEAAVEASEKVRENSEEQACLEVEIGRKTPAIHQHEPISPTSNIITSTRFLQGGNYVKTK